MNNEKYDEYYQYLDELRASRDSNMFEARTFLISEYPGLGKVEAGIVVCDWIKSYSEGMVTDE